MKIKKTTLTIGIFSFFLLLSCSKKGTPTPEDEIKLPSLPAITVTSSGEYIVNDLPGDITKSMDGKEITDDGGFSTVYYSLEDGRVVPKEYANTDKWDIAFSGVYNSTIWANNGSVKYESGGSNPGYGSPARGMFYLVVDTEVDKKYYNTSTHAPLQIPIPFSYLDEAYNKIDNVPVADDKFDFYGALGLNHFLASGNGYAYYDFYGNMAPGNAKKSHVVYNMARPIIIKTAKGNYAKIILYSFYKGKPENPTRDNLAPYLSFKYHILKDGTKEFKK